MGSFLGMWVLDVPCIKGQSTPCNKFIGIKFKKKEYRNSNEYFLKLDHFNVNLKLAVLVNGL